MNKNIWVRIYLVVTISVLLASAVIIGCAKKDKKDKVVAGSSAPALSGWTIVSSPDSPGFSWLANTAADADYLYIVGNDMFTGTSTTGWRIEKRSKSTGALDSGFGLYQSGIITVNHTATNNSLNSIAVDDTYLYTAGMVSATPQILLIEKRYKTTGALVNEFGLYNNGTITSVAGNATVPLCVIADSTYLYIGGYDTSGPGGLQEWRLEKRDKTTGALITGFGLYQAGVVTSYQSDTSYDALQKMVMDNDYLYMAGYVIRNSNIYWHIEKRDKISGTLAAGFGVGGVITQTAIGDVGGRAWNIAADDNYIYILGVNNAATNEEWRLEKRDKISGTPAAGFGLYEAGVITSYPVTYGMWAGSIVLDTGNVYIGGYETDASNNYPLRVEKRDMVTGALVTGFGTNGVFRHTTAVGGGTGGDNEAFVLLADSNYVYITGVTSNIAQSDYGWLYIKLIKSTGGQ